MTEPRDILILTATRRLARRLLFNASEQQKRNGKKVWDTPQIFDLRSWLETQWMESWPDHFFLSKLQSLHIWKNIIANDPECRQSREQEGIRKQWTLLHPRGAAKRAAEAYDLIKEYKLEIVPDPLALTHESQLFLRWLKLYKKHLQEHGALDPADLTDAVREGMKEKRIPLPKKIELRGFEEITPQLETWLDFLKAQKVQVTLNPDPRCAPSPALDKLARDRNVRLHSFTDNKEEAVQCARWIRSVFKPGKNIGVIVPQLAEYRTMIQNELCAELAPQSVYPWAHREPPFDISLGAPLADEPMVQTALHLLAIQDSAVPLPTFLYILKSPYLKSGRKNPEAGNMLEVKLQSENFTTVHLDRIDALYDRGKSPELHELIGEWSKFSGDTDARLPSARDLRHPSEWAKALSELLKNLGWPSDRDCPLTSREIQCLRKWNECLDGLASLDSLLGKLSRKHIAEELQRIVQGHLFQVKTKEEPILVADLEQSMGMTFDHLWVMGCHANCLPGQPDPNPFLPLALQKKRGLPHADPKRELQFAEQSLSRLIASSEDIVFSYPLWDKENELKPSPLLAQLSIKETASEIKASCRIKDHMPPDARLELWEDEDHLSPHKHEKEKFLERGLSGYAVLKDQAECPFRAFTAHRLRAKSMEMAEVDFDTRERGILIHKVMELFWKEHKTRQALQKLKEENKLADALVRHVRTAMQESGSRLFKQPRFSKLEEERSVQLLCEWMEKELQRPDFEVTHGEKKESVTLGGLKLNLRIDRIDTTPDGSILLIDYKTGLVKPGKWFTERIQEPQLPLYACKMNPQGIAFAGIAKGEIKWRSVTDQNSSLKPAGKTPRVPPETGWPDWGKLMDFWQTHLSALAQEFSNGRLVIDPVKPGDTCRNCGYHSLCRIGETEPDDENEEAE